MNSVRNRLVQVRPLRMLVQAWRTAWTLSEPGRFLRDHFLSSSAASYTSKRTGHLVALRPRADVQVARELLSKDAYSPPAAIEDVLSKRAPVILDLGANIGLYALSEVARYGSSCRVVAVEPDPGNVALLRRNVAQNGLEAQISVEQAAVATESGSALFMSGQSELSHVAREADDGLEAIEVPTRDAFSFMEHADVVKIDIEGSEWDILRDPRLREISAVGLALEWHAHCSQSNDPRSLARRLLGEAGFTVVIDESDAPHVGFMWGVRVDPSI